MLFCYALFCLLFVCFVCFWKGVCVCVCVCAEDQYFTKNAIGIHELN